MPRSRGKRLKEAKRRLDEELWSELRANRAYERDHRAGLRQHQVQPRHRPLPTTRPSRRPHGMATDHRDAQPPQTPPTRHSGRLSRPPARTGRRAGQSSPLRASFPATVPGADLRDSLRPERERARRQPRRSDPPEAAAQKIADPSRARLQDLLQRSEVVVYAALHGSARERSSEGCSAFEFDFGVERDNRVAVVG